MTHFQAAKLVSLIAARYPVPAWSDDEQDVYVELIEDLDYDSAKAAAMTAMRVKAERLDAAELRAMVVERQAKAIDAGLLAGDEAWGEVVKAITRVGRYRRPTSLHPLVLEVVDRIGWPTLCDSSNIVADRAHFLKMYQESLGRRMRDWADNPGAVPALPHLAQDRLPAPTRVSEQGNVRELLRATVARLEGANKVEQPGGDDEPDPDPTPEQIEARERRKAELRRQAELPEPEEDLT